VADPELRLVLGERLGNAIDRGQRLLLVEVEGRDDLMMVRLPSPNTSRSPDSILQLEDAL
jgi:hypothetical protein